MKVSDALAICAKGGSLPQMDARSTPVACYAIRNQSKGKSYVSYYKCGTDNWCFNFSNEPGTVTNITVRRL
jgi:hypothetical protein